MFISLLILVLCMFVLFGLTSLGLVLLFFPILCWSVCYSHVHSLRKSCLFAPSPIASVRSATRKSLASTCLSVGAASSPARSRCRGSPSMAATMTDVRWRSKPKTNTVSTSSSSIPTTTHFLSNCPSGFARLVKYRSAIGRNTLIIFLFALSTKALGKP